MPRQARLDAPGTLHHVMARGIEGTNIFRTAKDRDDLLDRLAVQCEADAVKVYAWALIPNISICSFGQGIVLFLRV